MDHFCSINIGGALLWVLLLTLCGYFFGNIPIVQDNFEWAILGIVAVSLIPILIERLRSHA